MIRKDSLIGACESFFRVLDGMTDRVPGVEVVILSCTARHDPSDTYTTTVHPSTKVEMLIYRYPLANPFFSHTTGANGWVNVKSTVIEIVEIPTILAFSRSLDRDC